jgi:hypothetical protein
MNTHLPTLAVLATLLSPAAVAQSYSLSEVTPPFAGFVTQAFSISDLGEVGVSTGDASSVGDAWVIGAQGARPLPALPGDIAAIPLRLCRTGRALGGSGEPTLDPMRAARWTPNGLGSELRGLPGAFQTLALDSNGQSRIVGFSAINPGFDDQPILWDHGVRTLLDLPAGFSFGEALGMNTRGDIVGVAWDVGFNNLGAWKRNGLGAPTRIDLLPGHVANQLNDINPLGLAVGVSLRGDGAQFAMTWQNGVSTALANPPGVVDCVLVCVGRFGDAVGIGTELATGNPEAIYFDGAGLQRLDDVLDSSGLGWNLLVANEINSSGAIAATGITPLGNIGACVLMPSPFDHSGVSHSPVTGERTPAQQAGVQNVLRRSLLGKGPLAQRLLHHSQDK